MRRGFTIAELLVAVGIFALVSALMFGALFGATEVFRRGEAARQAGDEATTVLTALRADLARMVPPRIRDGGPAPEAGWLHAAVDDPAGNVVLSFVIENPDLLTIGSDGEKARQIVTWFVSNAGTPGDASDDQLRRVINTWSPTGGDRNKARDPQPTDGDVITSGVLHFSSWLTVPGNEPAHGAFFRRVKTDGQPDWEQRNPAGDAVLPPWRSEEFDTCPAGWAPGMPYWSTPDAIRIALVLTGGGRFATRGTLVQDNDATVRVSGIKALPTIYGSQLRIENEWVRYSDFRNGLLTISQDGRGALRSDKVTHNGRPAVFAGQPFSLVLALPR
jgi:prepilin-type N-terminal cleavage/methylation domain-containing protein